MKILVIFLSLTFDTTQAKTTGLIAGGMRRLVEVLKVWSQFGHSINVLTTQDGEVLLQREGLFFQSYILKTKSIDKLDCLGVGVVLDYLYRLFASLKLSCNIQGEFEVIYTTSCLLPDVWAAFLLHRKYSNARVVVHLHHLFSTTALFPSFVNSVIKFVFFIRTLLSWFQQQVALWIVKRNRFYIFTYYSVLRDLSGNVDRTKIREIRSGLNLEFINQAKPTDYFDAVYLGRLSVKKGMYELIEIWFRVCRRLPSARLCLIGQVEDDGLFKAISSHSLWNNIVTKGIVEELKKYELLKSSKLFLFPSYEEGWGIAVTEAMACGLGVVAYDLPAYQAFKDCIVTIPIGNRELFAEACLQLLNNENLRKNLVSKAQQFIVNLDWKSIALQELSLISSLPIN